MTHNPNSVSQGESTLKPLCLFQRDKLYTNPNFVVAFLNPCFSPLYLKVYTYTMTIFIVKVSLVNWNKIRPKNTFYFTNSAQNRALILPDRAPIFYEWKCQFCSRKSRSDFDSFSKLQFLQFWVTFTTVGNRHDMISKNGSAMVGWFRVHELSIENSGRDGWQFVTDNGDKQATESQTWSFYKYISWNNIDK